MNQNLFNFHSQAKARNSDRKTSHNAADEMNRGDTMPRQQLAVLSLVSRHGGLTARELGRIMESETPGSYEFPRKRMRELETKGFVSRTSPGREMCCHITELGVDELKDHF